MTSLINVYSSPLGEITLSADETGLNGLWFDRQKYYGLIGDGRSIMDASSADEHQVRVNEILGCTSKWLDLYFAGSVPDFTPPLSLSGSPFRREVWEILLTIPYGETVTYGDIAKQIAVNHGKAGMSAQAVGGAVGHNPVSIIVPCHRVVGSNGSLTGYGGGIEKKIRLLELEKIDLSGFFIPARGTAL